jgi:hypothetical protein
MIAIVEGQQSRKETRFNMEDLHPVKWSLSWKQWTRKSRGLSSLLFVLNNNK